MISRHSGSLKYLQFEQLSGYPLLQGLSTRQGGVSPAPWSSLNLGGTVGDEPRRVQENKLRLLDALGCSEQDLYEVWQVHSARVVRARGPLENRQDLQRADAVVTDQPGLVILMRFADCVPVYLYDPVQHAAGLVHAGWQGTARRTSSNAVQAMADHFSSRPEDILAGIGPSIGPDHYEVGPEVVAAFRSSYGAEAQRLFQNEGALVKLDLWEANRLDLQQAGVEQIEIARICTACNQQDWFSHRGEDGNTGRFGGVLGLKERSYGPGRNSG